MPSTYFKLDQTNSIWLGGFQTIPYAGRVVAIWVASNSFLVSGPIVLYVKGTTLNAVLQGAWHVTVDADTQQSFDSGTVFTATDIMTGKDGSIYHTVTLTPLASDARLGVGDSATGLTPSAAGLLVTGAVPDLIRHPSYGPVYDMPNPALPYTQIGHYSSYPYMSTEGAADAVNGQGMAILRWGQSLRFVGNPTSIKILTYCDQQARYGLYMDNGANPIYVTESTVISAWDLLALNTSALDGAQHEYEIVPFNFRAGGGSTQPRIQCMLLIGGTLNTATSIVQKPVHIFHGDSITNNLGIYQAVASPTYDQHNCDAWNVSKGVNARPFVLGFDGTKIARGLADIALVTTALAVAPGHLWLRYVHNDVNGAGAAPTTIGAIGTPGTFTDDYNNYLRQVRAYWPTMPITCVGYFPASDGNFAAAPSYNAAIQVAIANGGSPISLCNFLNPLTAGSGGSAIFTAAAGTTDGVHPNVPVGYAAITVMELASLDAVPPSVPGGGLSDKTSKVAVTITWAPSTDNVTAQGAIAYSVYKDGSSIPLVTTAAGVTAFSEMVTADGTTHTYQIDAIDGSGNRSAKSATVAVVYAAPVSRRILR
jgi:hypothetical protein